MIPIRLLIPIATTTYQVIASWRDDRQSPPGQLIDIGGCKLHLYTLGEGSPTVILDSSLGGVEGYLLNQEIAKLTRVCVYDRPGYGWSEPSSKPRTSEQIVSELDALLTQAKIDPPYLLVGDSFGSYNVRLYAHRFPEKVAGMVLTDGLHEAAMLALPIQLQAMKFFFMSGFVMSTLGSALGIVRLLKRVGMFELLKPELRRFEASSLDLVKRSFCYPQHWFTMLREMLDLESSGQQLQPADQFGELPIVLISASSFFRPSWWTIGLPLKSANQLWKTMHREILKLSTNCVQIHADQSGHFVWVDQPELILKAIAMILNQTQSQG